MSFNTHSPAARLLFVCVCAGSEVHPVPAFRDFPSSGDVGADHAVVHVIQLSDHCAAGTQEGVRTGARARVQVQGRRSEDIFGLRSDSWGKRE